MKSSRELTPLERRLYHNPVNGFYRLNKLRSLLTAILDPLDI
jgi:hypothetical protein